MIGTCATSGISRAIPLWKTSILPFRVIAENCERSCCTLFTHVTTNGEIECYDLRGRMQLWLGRTEMARAKENDRGGAYKSYFIPVWMFARVETIFNNELEGDKWLPGSRMHPMVTIRIKGQRLQCKSIINISVIGKNTHTKISKFQFPWVTWMNFAVWS